MPTPPAIITDPLVVPVDSCVDDTESVLVAVSVVN
jgi:hypothetical protein